MLSVVVEIFNRLFTPPLAIRTFHRFGGDDVHFVHRVDVYAAPPEILVADLEPVLGTGLDNNGYIQDLVLLPCQEIHEHVVGSAQEHSHERKEQEARRRTPRPTDGLYVGFLIH